MSDVRVSHCVPVPVTSRCSLSLGSSVPASLLTAGARPGVPSLCSHWRLSVQAPGVTEADPERRGEHSSLTSPLQQNISPEQKYDGKNYFNSKNNRIRYI